MVGTKWFTHYATNCRHIFKYSAGIHTNKHHKGGNGLALDFWNNATVISWLHHLDNAYYYSVFNSDMAKSLFPKLYSRFLSHITESHYYASKHFPIGSHPFLFVHWLLLLFCNEMEKHEKTIKGFNFATLIKFCVLTTACSLSDFEHV